nr:hypothetical protein [Tanacetum cinerariifolium]
FTAINSSIDVFRKTEKNGLNSLIISFNLLKFLINGDVILDPNKTNEEHDKEEKYDDEFSLKDDENIDEEEDDEVTKELYKDVNVNLGIKDADMTYADQGTTEQHNASHLSRFEQEEEDSQVTLTPILNTLKTRGPTQSSSIYFDFTSKLLNLNNPSLADNEIPSLMYTSSYHPIAIPEITSSFATPTPPTHSFFNPLQQEVTPTPRPTTSKSTTSFTYLPDFASIFKFNKRATNLEKDLSEIKQVDQCDQALSFIPTIVDRYMDNKLREAINKAIKAHNFDCREEAQAEKREGFETRKTKIKTHSLDQSKGRKEENQVKMLSHPEIQGQRKRSLQVPLKMPPNLDMSLSASLHMKRSQVILLKTRACNKIRSSSWAIMMNNPLKKRLPKLTGSRNPSDLQLLVLIGVRDDKLTFDLLRPGLVKLYMLKNL